MKLSELIHLLQQAKRMHGDLEVVRPDNYPATRIDLLDAHGRRIEEIFPSRHSPEEHVPLDQKL